MRNQSLILFLKNEVCVPDLGRVVSGLVVLVSYQPGAKQLLVYPRLASGLCPCLVHAWFMPWTHRGKKKKISQVWIFIKSPKFYLYFILFSKDFIYLFLERGEGRERNIDVRNIDQLPLTCALTGNQTRNPGMCPDQKSNWWPFALWDGAQPTEPHWSGQDL